MKVEVNLISKELIKPSSPTPSHLRHLQFSFLDQILVPVSMPFVLFYANETNTSSNSEICNLLKKSLSKALTIFYPLAGRVKNNIYVDCNDEGVLFVETQANLKLLDILQHSNPENNNNLIPLQPDDAKGFAAFFQVTFFTCGGLAISFAMSHKLGDALSEFIFLNSWAAIASGDIDTDITISNSIPPFGTSTFFPPKDLSGFDPGKFISKDNIITKRFVFDLSTIAALKAKYTDDIRPSSVEALCAFIWSRFMVATQANKTDNNLYLVSQTLNLRPKMEPPLSKLHFGNICTTIPVLAANDDECCGIVSRMRDAITSVNVMHIQKSGGYLDFVKEENMKYVKDEVICLNFTSLCKFPVYEADFGWGKPVCVASARVPFKNLVIFMDTKEGDGIEAWISLKEEEMVKFEVDKELLLHVSSTTNEISFTFQTLKLSAQSKL